MDFEGPEILKFLTFLRDEVPDTCKHITYHEGKFSNADCSTIKWSAGDVIRENRLTDRLLSRLGDGAAFSFFGQNFACFDSPTSDPMRVRKFQIHVK